MASAKDYDRKMDTWRKSYQKWQDSIAAGAKPAAIASKKKQADKDLQQAKDLAAKLIKDGKLAMSQAPARAADGTYRPPGSTAGTAKFRPSGADTVPGQTESPKTDAQLTVEDEGLPIGKIAFAVVGLGAGLFLVKRFVLR